MGNHDKGGVTKDFVAGPQDMNRRASNRRLTRSAKLSSSCPIKLLLCLHRATFPSMKSKNRPNGINASAAQAFPKASGGPRQYRIEQTIDMKPQKPNFVGISLVILSL